MFLLPNFAAESISISAVQSAACAILLFFIFDCAFWRAWNTLCESECAISFGHLRNCSATPIKCVLRELDRVYLVRNKMFCVNRRKNLTESTCSGGSAAIEPVTVVMSAAGRINAAHNGNEQFTLDCLTHNNFRRNYVLISKSASQMRSTPTALASVTSLLLFYRVRQINLRSSHSKDVYFSHCRHLCSECLERQWRSAANSYLFCFFEYTNCFSSLSRIVSGYVRFLIVSDFIWI